VTVSGDDSGFEGGESVISQRIDATAGRARATTITTRRGSIATPCFMPVGTRATVRALDSGDLERLGTQVMLANTYHLVMRPGPEVVAAAGGLHRFMALDTHILTDSGGYQVFSLEPKVDDDGVTFRSTYDGDTHRFTPENVVEMQHQLGSDIQMVLDVCPPLPSSDAVIRTAVERTAAWARRAAVTHAELRSGGSTQAVFGIVQGGVDTTMRTESAQRTVDIGFDGYGIGGLSVGEPRHEMLPALEAALNELPVARPRYLMGVGDPRSIIEAVALGVDMFDCVLPTRLGRHGTVLTSQGRVNLRNRQWMNDPGPLDATCTCEVCARYSRAYLRHLLIVGEPTCRRLVTIHNVHWTFALVSSLRAAIVDGTFDTVRAELSQAWP
jgi:queuine tRNA-ribosyltransferase